MEEKKMLVFKVEMSLLEKDGFDPESLKKAIILDLKEVDLKLLGFQFESNCKDTCAEFPNLNKKVSVATLFIEHKNFNGLPYHAIVLGGLNTIQSKYPNLDIWSITPSFVEVNI